MADKKEYNGFRVGEKVTCRLNNRATLTVGKEYVIESMESYNGDLDISVTNDDGYVQPYTSKRFMDKSESRKHRINDILK